MILSIIIESLRLTNTYIKYYNGTIKVSIFLKKPILRIKYTCKLYKNMISILFI